MSILKWISIAGLLAAAGLWESLTPFQAALLRSAVAAGSLMMLWQALQAGRYAAAGVFLTLAVLFNPVSPALAFAGEWRRAVTAAGAVPFGASLLGGRA